MDAPAIKKVGHKIFHTRYSGVHEWYLFPLMFDTGRGRRGHNDLGVLRGHIGDHASQEVSDFCSGAQPELRIHVVMWN
jgi:hypothetical protein